MKFADICDNDVNAYLAFCESLLTFAFNSSVFSVGVAFRGV